MMEILKPIMQIYANYVLNIRIKKLQQIFCGGKRTLKKVVHVFNSTSLS